MPTFKHAELRWTGYTFHTVLVWHSDLHQLSMCGYIDVHHVYGLKASQLGLPSVQPAPHVVYLPDNHRSIQQFTHAYTLLVFNVAVYCHLYVPASDHTSYEKPVCSFLRHFMGSQCITVVHESHIVMYNNIPH